LKASVGPLPRSFLQTKRAKGDTKTKAYVEAPRARRIIPASCRTAFRDHGQHSAREPKSSGIGSGTLSVITPECCPPSLRNQCPAWSGIRNIDNGGEFLNDILLGYCGAEGIAFTRSRPYHKNDQAWVEQKNGSVVRRFVGYHRLEGSNAVEALARLYSATRLFVNFFQPSFKLKEKVRTGSRILKRYHAPETPTARLLASDAVSSEIKARLDEITAKLDPLQLLDEIRRVQHHIVRIADGEDSHATLPQRDDLSRFLASLSTAWRVGEVRPTHRSVAKSPRHWRTRIDPFASGWSQVCEWLEVDPDLTGLELFERLQRHSPGVYPRGQLRTLQRRLKHWRMGMARSLIFGVHASTANKEFLPPAAADRASPDERPAKGGKPTDIKL
jgi:hypothetical protein